MIPVCFEPFAQSGLYDPKVNDTTDRVNWTAAVEANAVVVAMEMSALAFVADNSVAATDVVIPRGYGCSHGYWRPASFV